MADSIIKRPPLNMSIDLKNKIYNSKVTTSSSTIANCKIKNGIAFLRLEKLNVTQTSYNFEKVMAGLPTPLQAEYSDDREGKITWRIFPNSGDLYLSTYSTFSVGEELPAVTFSYPIDDSWTP